MITVSESVMHTLTVTIPAYATWFAENFVNLIEDAFNGVIAVITNAGPNHRRNGLPDIRVHRFGW
jgi:hypothetical protein